VTGNRSGHSLRPDSLVLIIGQASIVGLVL